MRISNANPDTDSGRYRLRAFNPHGEVFCEADIKFDGKLTATTFIRIDNCNLRELFIGLDSRHRRPLDDQYKDHDRYRSTGAPLPLTDRPIISMMTDRHLTLSWKPTKPIGPREPVTYSVEMEEQPKGNWYTARSGKYS